MQIVSQTYLEEISYFLMWTQEKTILTDVNGRWQKSDFLSKHMEGPSYGYGRGWRMTKQTNKNHHKIQNSSQSLQQEICCSIAARAGGKLPAAYRNLKEIPLFLVNSVFVQTLREGCHLLHIFWKGNFRSFSLRKQSLPCLDVKASCQKFSSCCPKGHFPWSFYSTTPFSNGRTFASTSATTNRTTCTLH